MKKFLLGAGWSLVIWFAALLLGGMVLGAVEGVNAVDAETAIRAGEVAGENFGARFGNALLLGSIAISGIGTYFGWLPGTGNDKTDVVDHGATRAA